MHVAIWAFAQFVCCQQLVFLGEFQRLNTKGGDCFAIIGWFLEIFCPKTSQMHFLSNTVFTCILVVQTFCFC